VRSLTKLPGRGQHSAPRRATLALLAFAQLIVAIDAYIVVVALPDIGRELGFSNQTLQTVISAYAVAFGGFLLLGGRAADLLGRRRMFIAGMFLYAISSLAGGLAGAPEILLAARVVQGLGGALVFPATLSLINTTFAEGPERNRALAVWGGAGAAGLVLGVLLGGALTTALGWQAVFLVNVPLATVALGLAFSLIAADRKRERSGAFDIPGALSASFGITLLVFALVQGPELGWGSPAILASSLMGGLLLVAFVVIEARSRDPLMPLGLLANRNLSAAVAITLLFMATFGSVLYFLTLYFQNVHGYDALQTGVAFLLPTAFVVGGSALGGQLATRFGLRATLVGALALGALDAGARLGDVRERLLRRPRPRAHPAQHRRRRRLHHRVHSSVNRRRPPRPGHRLRHGVNGDPDRRRRRPRNSRPDRQLANRRPDRRSPAHRGCRRPACGGARRRSGHRSHDPGRTAHGGDPTRPGPLVTAPGYECLRPPVSCSNALLATPAIS